MRSKVKIPSSQDRKINKDSPYEGLTRRSSKHVCGIGCERNVSKLFSEGQQTKVCTYICPIVL